ncbi:MAG TPA: RsmE family RNA methyltransferase [Chitinophagaceae bacterium]|jgi:16S rRNA (uracil1498-N3)-methyltransferase
MSLPYFFIKDLSNSNTIILPEDTSKHCMQVLRMKEGEQVQLTDGKGNLAIARITSADRRYCSVNVEEKKFEERNSRKISVALSLLKNQGRFEWFVEKATEIGISEIIPLICERTERQHFRWERTYNILVAAMLQSEQVWLPILHEPQPFEKMVIASAYPQKLIAYCGEDDNKKDVASIKTKTETQILIGPEGDFTNPEIKQALTNSYIPVSLGRTRLRSETAGVVAITLLMNSE